MREHKPKIVVVGCGQIANLGHLPALLTLQNEGRVEIAGVCDGDLQRAEATASAFAVPHHGSDWRKLVEETAANAVALIVPPGPSTELAVQALDLGLHVITEKPPARDAAQAERMAVAAAARPELVHMIAFNRRFTPLYTKAVEASRALGHPHAFYGRFSRGALGAMPSNTVSDWISSDGSHALDLAIATIGFPHSVSVARQRAGVGPDNTWTIHLVSERGSAVVLFDFAAGRRVERFEWTGPGYDVMLELPDRGEWCQQGAPVQPWLAAELTQTTEYAVNYGFLGEHRYFADAVAGLAPRPESDFAYGARFMRLVETILASASGESHRIDPAPVSRRAAVSAEPLPRVAVRVATNGGAGRRPVVQLMQPAAAQTGYFAPELLARIAERADLRLSLSGGPPDRELADVDVVVAGWGASPLTREQIAAAEQLQLAVVLGASVQWCLPVEDLTEREIPFCNTADAIAQSVAEHCLLLTLAGLRRLPSVDRKMHQGEWPPRDTRFFSARNLMKVARGLPMIDAIKPALRPVARKVLARAPAGGAAWHDLQGQAVGLIGWGHIARHFARLLQPFGCELLICSDHAPADELRALGARRASLGEVLGACRVISLHRGLTDSTRGMLDAAKLAMINRGSVLVNTARAGLTDEAALIERARRGDIIVALDVFHTEPLPRKHPLRELDNVILTPHNASSTPQCARRVGTQALDVVLDWLSGTPVPALDAGRLAAMT